jgi:tetratricopeptide (TPR) repeat protein
MVLATFLAEVGNREKAEAEYSAIVQHAGTSEVGLGARARLAALALGRGDLKSAEKLVGEVLERSPREADALLVRGSLRLQQGDSRGAVEDLRAASRDVPNSVPVLLALGRAHAASGDSGLAEEAYRRAVEVGAGEAAPSFQLASFLLGQGRAADARDVLRGVFAASADDPSVDETTLRAALGAHDHALAQEVIAKARNAQNGTARASFYAGLTAVAEGHRDEALKHYLDSVDKDPSAAAPVVESVKLLLANNRRADALKLLDNVSAKVPTSAAAPLLKGDTLLADRDFGAAETAYREALRRQPKLAAAYRGLGYVILGRGDVDGAVTALVDAAPKSDDPGRLLASAGQLLELSGRVPAAIDRYEAAMKALPSDTGLRAQTALLLLSVRDDAAARKRAGELVSGMAESPSARLRDAFAFVELRSGDAPGALRMLERLELEQANDPLIAYHLGAARQQTGDREGAIKLLSAAVSSGRRFVGEADARQRLATLKGSN